MAILTKEQIIAQVDSLLASAQEGGIIAANHRETMYSIIDKAYDDGGIPDAPNDSDSYVRGQEQWNTNQGANTGFDNTATGFTATNTQAAIDELKVYTDSSISGQSRYRGLLDPLSNPNAISDYLPIVKGDFWVVPTGTEVAYFDGNKTYANGGTLYADADAAIASECLESDYTLDPSTLSITQKVQPVANELLFDDVGGYVTGTPSAPVSAASFDVKTANTIAGVVCMIYYQGSSIPSFTSATVTNFTPTNFVPNEVCLLTIILHPVAGYVMYVSAPAEPLLQTKQVADENYVLVSSDRNKVLEFTFAGNVTVTCPQGLAVGYSVGFVNNTTGTVTFTDDATSVIVAEGLSLATAATAASLLSWGLNRYQLIGKLS